jgi:small subunit ribosomal protein S15
MAITMKTKKEVIDTFKRKDKDTGSSEVQIALFTERINYLTEHFKEHTKDHHSRMGLLRLVNKRRKLLEYLKKENAAKYKELINNLKLRK